MLNTVKSPVKNRLITEGDGTMLVRHALNIFGDLLLTCEME